MQKLNISGVRFSNANIIFPQGGVTKFINYELG